MEPTAARRSAGPVAVGIIEVGCLFAGLMLLIPPVPSVLPAPPVPLLNLMTVMALALLIGYVLLQWRRTKTSLWQAGLTAIALLAFAVVLRLRFQV